MCASDSYRFVEQLHRRGIKRPYLSYSRIARARHFVPYAIAVVQFFPIEFRVDASKRIATDRGLLRRRSPQ
jgi:hypothetical protein